MKKSNKTKLIDLNKPILCSIESLTPIMKNSLEIVDEKLRIVNSNLAVLDTISRNRSLYDMEGVLRSLDESKLVQEKIAQGVWTGEKEHPPKKCKLDRFMKVLDKKVSHKIYKYWVQKDGLMRGKIQFVPPYGDMVWRWITEASMNLAFSLRIYTPNYIQKEDENGSYMLKKYPMYPVTWDCVNMPGYYKSRLIDPDEFAKKNQDYLSNKQPDSISTESWLIDNPIDDITDIIYEESTEAFNIIQDLYGIDISEARAILSEDRRKVSIRKDEVTLNIPINQYLVGQILGSQ